MTTTQLRQLAPPTAATRGGSPAGDAGGRPRVALYGHDTLGLGHLRRNLALAGALSSMACEPDVLVVSGLAEAGQFPRAPRVDLLTLPGVAKAGDGGYGPAHLAADLDEVVDLRTAVLTAALTAWAPDLLVVDKVPLGFAGELRPALRALRRRGRTATVLGLRDVLDDPQVARDEWRRDRCSEAVRDLYDEVWVYGDPRTCDLPGDCAFPPAVRARTRCVGLLSAGRCGPPASPPGVTGQRYVLGLVGGGRDGGQLAEAFAAATLPAGRVGVLLTGPFLPDAERAAVEAQAARRRDLVVVPFAADAAGWIAGADAVVAMGGYNTVAEILATDTPALIVPRTAPRREQLVRAERLHRAGLVDLTLPGRAGAHPLSRWLAAAVAGPRTDRSALDRDGLAAVARRAGDLLDRGTPTGHGREPVPGVATALASRPAATTTPIRTRTEAARAAS